MTTSLHWRVKNLVGQRFERLTVISHAGQRSVSRNHFWNCVCACGATVTVDGAHLRSGATKSCGCYARNVARAAGDRTRTHGMARSSTYNIWRSMLARCENPSRKDYPRYGGRGITVCKRWHKFESFLADMGERPAGLSLDRRNNDRGYTRANCHWATGTEQARNSHANRILEWNCVRQTVAAWAEDLGIAYNTLTARLRRGWDVRRSLCTPVDKRFSHA